MISSPSVPRRRRPPLRIPAPLVAVVLMLVAGLAVAARAQALPRAPDRKERRVTFSGGRTRVSKAPAWCGEDGPSADKTRTWTPSNDQVDAFERELVNSLGSPHRDKQWFRREFRQHFGVFCGRERRIFMIALPGRWRLSAERERKHLRPAGYAGQLWRVLPFEYWSDADVMFAVYDPVRRTQERTFEPPYAHRVRWPSAGPPRRADAGSFCMALGFGRWSDMEGGDTGGDWLPPGWNERFPHLELRTESIAGWRRLRLAPHSPRPGIPTLRSSMADTRWALVFDGWRAGTGDSIELRRWIVLGMGLFVNGAWRGDTLRAHAAAGGDNIMVDASGRRIWDGEAHAFAVRYPCDDPRAAEAAEQAMERLRADSRQPLPSIRGGRASP